MKKVVNLKNQVIEILNLKFCVHNWLPLFYFNIIACFTLHPAFGSVQNLNSKYEGRRFLLRKE